MHTDLCTGPQSRASINVTSHNSTGNFMGHDIFAIVTRQRQLRLAVRGTGSEITQLRFRSPLLSFFFYFLASCKNYHKLIMQLDISFIGEMEFYKLRSS